MFVTNGPPARLMWRLQSCLSHLAHKLQSSLRSPAGHLAARQREYSSRGLVMITEKTIELIMFCVFVASVTATILFA
jgi:hypothetical protein